MAVAATSVAEVIFVAASGTVEKSCAARAAQPIAASVVPRTGWGVIGGAGAVGWAAVVVAAPLPVDAVAAPPGALAVPAGFATALGAAVGGALVAAWATGAGVSLVILLAEQAVSPRVNKVNKASVKGSHWRSPAIRQALKLPLMSFICILPVVLRPHLPLQAGRCVDGTDTE